MTLVYQVTEAELRRVHLAQTKRVLRRRLANALLPWRWLRPQPALAWFTWESLLRQCARHEGCLIVTTGRGQEIRYRLVAQTALPPERWHKGSQPRPPSPPLTPSSP